MENSFSWKGENMGKTVPKGLSIYPDFATNELKENPHQPYEWIIKLYSKNKTNNLQNREKGGKKKNISLKSLSSTEFMNTKILPHENPQDFLFYLLPHDV